MDLQVDDFPFRQEQVATSGDKQSKAKQSQCRRVKRQNRLRHLAGLVCFARGHGAAICFPRLLVLCHSLQLRSSAACKPHTGGEQNLLFHPVPARAHHVVGTHCSVTDGTHLLSPFFSFFVLERRLVSVSLCRN